MTVDGAEWRLPPGHAVAAEAARQRSPEPPAPWVMQARIVTLAAPPVEDVTAEILMLVGPGGVVETLKASTHAPGAAFKRQVAKLGRIKLPIAFPDEHPAKLVLTGLLSCNKLTNCSVVLDVPGVRSFAGADE